MNAPGHPPLAVLGNYTCANRGDAAILRGVIAGLEHLGTEPLRLYSDQPDVAEYLLGRTFVRSPIQSSAGGWVRSLTAYGATFVPHVLRRVKLPSRLSEL